MTVNAAAKPGRLSIGGLEFPGFISYEGNDNEIDLSGLITHSGRIVVGATKANPESVNPRKNRPRFCFGTEVLLQVLDSTGTWQVHPRGRLYILNSFYDIAERKVTIEVGCKLSLFKSRGAEDFLTIQDKVIFANDGPVDIASTVLLLLQRSGINDIQIGLSGLTHGPISAGGSLIQTAGELAIKSSPPSFLYQSKTGQIRSRAIDFVSASPFFVCTIGHDEVSYKPIEKGASNGPVGALRVTGTIKVPKTKEPNDDQEQTQEDGTRLTIEQEYGPEKVADPVFGTDNEILLAQTITTETANGLERERVVVREERKGLVFPSTSTDRLAMVLASETSTKDLYDATGKKQITIENIAEPFGKVYSEWLANHSNWVVPGTSGSSAYADELMVDATPVLSTNKIIRYEYTSKDVLRKQSSYSERPIAAMLPQFAPFLDDFVPSEQVIETWRQNGQDQYHKTVRRIPVSQKYSSYVSGIEKTLKAAGVNPIKLQITVFKRTGATAEISAKTVNAPLVPWDQQLAMVAAEVNLEVSRAGVTNPPGTEYLGGKDAKNKFKDELEDAIFETARILDDSCPIQAPIESIDVGAVHNEQLLSELADILYYIRQGQVFGYELILAMGDIWYGEYNPLPTVIVVEPDATHRFILTGLTFTMEPMSNLVLGDALWLGTHDSSSASASNGQIIVSTTDSSLYNLGDTVSIGGSTNYYVVAVNQSGGQYAMSVAPSMNATPITVVEANTIVNTTASRVTIAFPLLRIEGGGTKTGGFGEITTTGINWSTINRNQWESINQSWEGVNP